MTNSSVTLVSVPWEWLLVCYVPSSVRGLFVALLSVQLQTDCLLPFLPCFWPGVTALFRTCCYNLLVWTLSFYLFVALMGHSYPLTVSPQVSKWPATFPLLPWRWKYLLHSVITQKTAVWMVWM
jgi:hypothetical protein